MRERERHKLKGGREILFYFFNRIMFYPSCYGKAEVSIHAYTTKPRHVRC